MTFSNDLSLSFCKHESVMLQNASECLEAVIIVEVHTRFKISSLINFKKNINADQITQYYWNTKGRKMAKYSYEHNLGACEDL